MHLGKQAVAHCSALLQCYAWLGGCLDPCSCETIQFSLQGDDALMVLPCYRAWTLRDLPVSACPR